MKRFNLLFVICTLALSSCSDSFLDRETFGGSIRQDQYEQFDNTLDGTMRGIYASLYAYGGSHETFGKRSIDMYGDICAGDMALTAYNFGQFYSDETLQTNTDRAGYIWNLYYSMLHNINALIRDINKDTQLIVRLNNATSDSVANFSAEQIKAADYYAQALTMRAYIYRELLMWFCPPTQDILHHPVHAYTWDNYPTFPIHTENDMDEARGYANLRQAYDRIEKDYKEAIRLFTLFDGKVARPSKITVDLNVARAMLAYSYLNKADVKDATSADYTDACQNALKYAEEVINSGEYAVIPASKILNNGFNDVNNDSWMWAQDVTSENTTNLASFFGQVDIHTYSYAWAGDTKAIDRNLYNEIPDWDARKRWFRKDDNKDIFALCPDGKYFSAKNQYSTLSEDVDREWLSDNVYLRVEAVYLTAAEAACRLNQFDLAKQYLTAITDQRIDPDDIGAAAQYTSYKTDSLSNDRMMNQIKLNWRVELWGEGYAWQTFRRMSTFVKRGSNHAFKPGETIEKSSNPGSAIADDYFCLVIPPDEIQYNPNM